MIILFLEGYILSVPSLLALANSPLLCLVVAETPLAKAGTSRNLVTIVAINYCLSINKKIIQYDHTVHNSVNKLPRETSTFEEVIKNLKIKCRV